MQVQVKKKPAKKQTGGSFQTWRDTANVTQSRLPKVDRSAPSDTARIKSLPNRLTPDAVQRLRAAGLLPDTTQTKKPAPLKKGGKPKKKTVKK